MTRWRLAFSLAATLWAGVVGAVSLLPDMGGLPGALILLAPVPAVLALLAAWRDPGGVPPKSLPLWTRLLWLAGLGGCVVLVVIDRPGYSLTDGTRAELARFAPSLLFGAVWFGYNAVLSAWARLRGAAGAPPVERDRAG